MLIDKNGRVFGKINVIDLIAIVLLLLLASFIGTRFLLPTAGEEAVYLQLFTAEEEGWVAEKIQVNAPVYDREAQTNLGYITAVDMRPPESLVLSASGEYVPAVREGSCALYLSVQAMGKKTENGAEIDGNPYAVGQSLLLYAGEAQISARIRDIQSLDNKTQGLLAQK